MTLYNVRRRIEDQVTFDAENPDEAARVAREAIEEVRFYGPAGAQWVHGAEPEIEILEVKEIS